ncbi:MAG: hypothetical protein PF484_09045 [Bacteroidales bacterium]|jgi:hypothetical protein|nr:hypothetical protein [Bacteroidales bacterium]
MRHLAILHWNPSIVALIIGMLILFSSGKVQAQQNDSILLEDPALYFKTLEQHFKIVQKNQSNEAEIFLQDLRIKWEYGFFSDEIKSQIYVTTNKMFANKMTAIPNFSHFFSSLINIIEGTYDNKSIMSWILGAQYTLDHKNKREFSSFVIASDNLFNNKLIYYNRAVKWEVNKYPHSILFQNDLLQYVFSETDLVCYSRGDSTNIISTKGAYFPFSNIWEGDGGRLSWERANYSIDSVYAELKRYSIPMQFSKFFADSVLFYHHYYFQKPILGKLNEQVLAARRGGRAIYPKFKSYEKKCKITNIFPNMDFSGGVLFEGSHLQGFGDASTQASITIRQNDTAILKLRSNNFSILPNQILSKYASVSIRYKNDSIYHSGLHMNYSRKNQLLSFVRDDKGITANPFYNTYHQIEMYVEAMYWNMEENKISFDMAKGRIKQPAHFESYNFFSEFRFNRLQGIDLENPLQALKRYSDVNSSKTVYFDEYAKYLNKPIEQVQLLLLKLAHQGFLLYDSNKQSAILSDKIDFYFNANARVIDSDVIRFKSQPNRDEANAYLHIDNFDLQINGIDRIILSDSQNLIIEPSNRSIVLGKNKDFRFDGKITAGRLSFATTESTFDYDEFKLDMPSIDSLWFWVKGPQLPDGSFERINVQTAICDLSGDLLIDHPNNKSGLESRNEYPIFNSEKDSYVYYNKTNIQNGVYSKDRFYFHVNPFTFSSLNTFITDDIAFTGYLASSNIFPDISQPLTVQEDYSLGFTATLPPKGIMAYGNKGRFYNKVNLSNQGLIGDGILTFINSTTKSTDFLFLPDSVNMHAQSFELKPTITPVEFPSINATNTYQHWMPYEETMQISTINETINMYDNETSMSGYLFLSPKSLSGKGDIHFKVAKMYSDNYTFKNQTFDSPKTNFIDDGNILNNFRAHTDYTDRTIVFVSNDGSSKVDFPDNLYICYMDQATWYMDKEITDYSSSLASDPDQFSELKLRQLADTEYKGANFISQHKQQDSLSFFSSTATFNSKEKIISAKGVHYIKIADAVIFPEQSSITILKNAQMIPLNNSKIIANAVTKYHEIINATVKIESSKSYKGSGDYVYIDNNDTKQKIYFNNIHVDPTYQTVASSEIFAEDYFTLSDEFYFRGFANLKASRKLLEFDGGFKIANNCGKNQSWIKFITEIDPENIMIPIAVQPMVPDASLQEKYVGILYSSAQQKAYSSFLNNKINYYDPLILTAHGFISFDSESKEFRISTREKLDQFIRPDNYFSLNSRDCSTYGEGKINMDVNFPDLTIESYGNIRQKDLITNIRLGAAINFHFSSNAIKHISDQFASTTVIPVDNISPYYSKMIAGFLGTEETEQYISKLLLGNLKRIPDRLIHTILLNDLKLRWNTKLEAYISEGNFGIESLDKYRINALVEGNVEIKKSRVGDELTIYFEINGHWYFFKYFNNVMQVLSSNDIFNKIIQSDMDSRSEKNRMKQDKTTGKRSNYRYILSTLNVKDDFLMRLNAK